MSKLYVGNLPTDVNEGTLRQLFQDHSLSCTTILVKRGGYAFVECTDQATADRAIDKLNGYNFLGSSLIVEPSVAGGAKKSAGGKIVLTNLPLHVRIEDLEPLLTPFGSVQNCEKLNSRDGSTQIVQVSYETQEQAQQAVSELSGYVYEGVSLKVEFSMERRSRGRGGSRGGAGAGFSGLPGSGRQTDFPLRILVQSDMVGAIIGRQGSTIRQITQQTRARVDVHRKDNVGSLEKAITIYGNPDNCTNACRRILEVMQQEANNTNKGEISLKILAHNNLIGRIIGKGGNTIKRIMQDTDTKITVSSINDINSFNLERIITVKGSIENMSKAEALISAKLRQSYENDLQAMAPQSMMFPGLHPMAMMSTSNMGFTSRGSAGFPGGMYGAGPAPYPSMYQSSVPAAQSGGAQGGDTQETTFLYIPNNAVGAIIGTKGTHIRNIIRFSGASVKIAPLEQDRPQDQQTERKVTIVGSPESQWKAQYLIFEKMREEGFVAGTDDVRLTVEILVPSSQVGRIIGKGGQNVRELQRVTGSIIKLPEQGASPPSQDEETTVHIIGPFFSVQSAQRRIRAMVLQAQPLPAGARGGQRGAPSRREPPQQ
ncbi:insulin-like growth factor 2 mRNA-binding protein 1 isoform X2 [Cryptotermes secundus]|uniref:insulin-like growth factor 2 mRNA-binding protein 1 isoform X2 n=1 Tax=Cryptotermes secundus TaxID=105785 RepID=UPI000CD7BF2C|nr:insulin-like growth factor 2 mRNA-binding protein 1 isoform X2 [Cryptotermes secundus]